MFDLLRHRLLSLAIWAGIAVLLVLVWAASVLSVVLFGWWDKDRRVVHECVKCWAKAVIALNPYWRLQIDDQAKLNPHSAYVFVANHQSLADVVVLPHVGLPYKCLSKASLFHFPFVGWTLSLSRHIPLKRGSLRSTRLAMEQARAWLKRRMPVVFFAEGTRSRTGVLQPFKPGAFKLAVETGAAVVPLAITGTRDALPRGTWCFRHKVHGKLTILPPIPTRNLNLHDVDQLRQRAVQAIAAVLQQAQTT